MVLMLVGTAPIKELPMKKGFAKFKGGELIIDDYSMPSEQILLGTASMVSAAAVMCEALSLKAPYVVIAGDLGRGDGSRKVYAFLTEEAFTLSPKVLTMHYILPVRTPFVEFMEMLDYWPSKPTMIADAGSMLVAKAVGACETFDLFTPDPGEISFLGDPDAAHPAYVSHFLFEIDTTDVPRLIKQAYEHNNSPSVLLVKGPVDFVAKDGEIIETIREPNVPALEAIGGTGDTITGIVSALAYAGHDLVDAAIYAAKINRVAGLLAKPTPATKISEIIPYIPEAWKVVKDQTSSKGV